MEDIGVRAVVDGVDTYVKDMGKMQTETDKTAESTENLSKSGEKQSKVMTTNMRPALVAVSSMFHVLASATLFAMASSDKMSGTMRTVMKVLTGLSLAVVAVTTAYRLYIQRAVLASVATTAWGIVCGIASEPVWALALAVNALLWPFALLTAAIAAVVAVVYILNRYWDIIVEMFKRTTPTIGGARKSIEEMTEAEANLTIELEEHEKVLKKLQDEYDYVDRNAAGYQTRIKSLEDQIKSETSTINRLKESLSAANSELRELTEPRLTGMQAYDDQIQALNQQINELRLQELQYGESDYLSGQIADLEKQREIVQLTRDTTYDPLIYQAKEAAETIQGLNEEMAPADAMARIAELGIQIATQNTELEAASASLTAHQTELDRINVIVATTLDTVNEKILQEKNAMYLLNVELEKYATTISETQKAIDEGGGGASVGNFMRNIGDWASRTGESILGLFPGFQHGGVSKGGPTWVGERGRELVVLPAGAAVIPNNTWNFNVNANYTNPQQPQSIGQDLESIRLMSRV